MSGADRAANNARNKARHLVGRAKEATGKAMGHKRTENRGRVDQAKAHLHDAGEKVRNSFDKLASRRHRHTPGGTM